MDLSLEAEESKRPPVLLIIILIVGFPMNRSCVMHGVCLSADGLAPPFFAQMGPSVLDSNVFLKNSGSGIKWESLEEVESHPTVVLS